MKIKISVGRCLKRKTMLARVKEYINKSMAKVFVTLTYVLLSKKITQIKILDPQSFVPWDQNGIFWLSQKWLTLFEFVTSSICCVARRCNGLGLDIQRSDQKNFVLPCISIKIYLWWRWYHHHSQEYFF